MVESRQFAISPIANPDAGEGVSGRTELARGRRLGWRRVLILVLFSGSLLGWCLGSARTLSYHECPAVQGALEMLDSGQWLVPTIGHEPWLEKPPLVHWSVAAVAAVCGVMNEALARFPSCICSRRIWRRGSAAAASA